MHNRILDISETGVKLSVRHRQLIITQDHGTDVSVPFSDIAVVVLANPQILLTQPVLAALAEEGGILVTCSANRLPAGMLLPLQAHSLQTARFAAQAACPLPTRKRLWQQLVRAKIAAQAEVLSELRQSDFGLRALLPSVRSGDPSNVEAQAARKYWSALFSSSFRRDPEASDQNCLLNYGYALLRAIVARALCAAGLHPTLGLHHHNQYNAFCLADDLMEPFRPLVDRTVALFVGSLGGTDMILDQQTRRALLEVLTGRCQFQGEQRTLFDAVGRAASSLTEVFLGTRQDLVLPEQLTHAAM